MNYMTNDGRELFVTDGISGVGHGLRVIGLRLDLLGDLRVQSFNAEDAGRGPG